ncbi:MAG: endonuclease MutS2 [Nitrospinae bacterium]|nr:endonuclease MutS2 [Nitrospinota bacterium]
MTRYTGAQVATEHALRVLEFDGVRHLLGRCMSSELGRSLLPTVTPLSEPSLIRQKQRETSEAKALLREGSPPSLQQLVDPRPLLDQVGQQGKVLDPHELLDLQFLFATAKQVRRSFVGMADTYPLLADLIQPMELPEPLERAIAQAVDPRGELPDGASPFLQEIRTQARSTRDRVKRLLERHLTQHKEVVQEPLITLRNNRYVLPLKTDYRRLVAGIVHDHSASKATVFVEPLDVLELNNRLVELADAEESEVYRILRQLTTAVWEVREQIRHIADTLAALDYILARARLSQVLHGHEPVLTEGGRIELIQARHPLLVVAGQGSLDRPGEDGAAVPVVPCTLAIGADDRTLVITGPNTGGKTVLLKTVGLLTLMAQAGLHIPAEEGSHLTIFRRVLADIGDEQSIAQSLSTFSGHMRHIITFLREVDDRSLVLLDELGAGTDPAEGAALGIAILEHLHSRGAKTLVTTHHTPVKTLAYLHPQMATAAMEFDSETLEPTFRVIVGRFGGSNALAISQRLGMPAEVLVTARSHMEVDEHRLGEVADRLQEELRALEKLRREAEKDRLEAAHVRAAYEARLAAIEEECRRRLAGAADEGRQLLAEARRRLDEAIQEVRRQGVVAVAGQGRDLLRQVEAELEAVTANTRPPEAEAKPLRVGEAVWLPMWRIRGILLSRLETGDVVKVQAGQMTLKVPMSQLEPLRETEGSRETSPITPRTSRTDAAGEVSPELNLIGWRVEDALPHVDKYLDRALAAGLQRVRIIHGKGSGRLRAAVHQLLTTHPQVKALIPCSPAEGGWGATAVEIDA